MVSGCDVESAVSLVHTEKKKGKAKKISAMVALIGFTHFEDTWCIYQKSVYLF